MFDSLSFLGLSTSLGSEPMPRFETGPEESPQEEVKASLSRREHPAMFRAFLQLCAGLAVEKVSLSLIKCGC